MDALVTEAERQDSATPLSQQSRREQAIALHRNGHIEHAVEFHKDHLKQHPQLGLGLCNLFCTIWQQSTVVVKGGRVY